MNNTHQTDEQSVTPQPDAILDLIELLKARHAQGLATYGVPVDFNAASPEQWLLEAIAEKADDLVYSFAALKAVHKLQQRVATLEAENRTLNLQITEYKSKVGDF